MNRTPKQVLASTLRRREYQGCTGQTSSHGCNRNSIQIFAQNSPENSGRFLFAKLNAQGTLIVADFDL